MKNFIIFTLTFLPILLFGQNPRVFTVKCNISQSGGGAGYWTVSATNINDPLGLYDATEITIGDSLQFNDGGIQYSLGITLVVSAVGNQSTFRVSNVGITGISSVPTTSALISRGTPIYGFVPWTANLSDADNQVNQENTMRLIEVAVNRAYQNAAEVPLSDPIDFGGVVVDTVQEALEAIDVRLDTASQNFANTNLAATANITHTGNTGGAYRDLTFSQWGRWTSDFRDTTTKPVIYDLGGFSTSNFAGVDTIFGARFRPTLTATNASNVYSAFRIEPIIVGSPGAFSSLFSVKPSSLSYDVFSVRGNSAIGQSELRVRFGSNISDAALIQCTGANAIFSHGLTTGILQLKLGANTYFNIDNSNDIAISATSNSTASATSTVTQVGSRKMSFLNALWNGSIARSSSFTLVSEASTSTNLLTNFRLKYLDATGGGGTFLDINSLTGKFTITPPTGGSSTIPNELLELNGTSSFLPPRGTTAQRPASPTTGAERYNSTTTLPEWFDGTNWNNYGVSGSSMQTAASGATTVVTDAVAKADIKIIVAQITGASTVVNLPALAAIPAGKEVTVKFQIIDAGQTATIGVNGGGVNIDAGTTVSFSDTDDWASITFYHNSIQYFIK